MTPVRDRHIGQLLAVRRDRQRDRIGGRGGHEFDAPLGNGRQRAYAPCGRPHRGHDHDQCERGDPDKTLMPTNPSGSVDRRVQFAPLSVFDVETGIANVA